MKYLLKLMATCGFVAVSCLLAAGCDSVTQPRMQLSPDFGDAVRHNMAAQIVNPDAAAGITEAPTFDGNRANAAMTEYQIGKTKVVKTIKTTNVGADSK